MKKEKEKECGCGMDVCVPHKEQTEKRNGKDSVIYRAIEFAKRRHGSQKDDCNLNYFESHVCAVARLVQMVAPKDQNLIAAAYLHDTLEDTPTSYE